MTRKVVVVGGGMGGMTAALALARRGQSVHLLEKAAEFKEVGAGLQLGPNVMKIFDRLGVLDDVHDVAFFPENLLLMDALDGTQLAKVPLGSEFQRAFGYRYATAHRADLLEILEKASRNASGITLETNSPVTEVGEDKDRAYATLADGTTYDGDLLVGADGIWSTVRQALLNDGEPRVTGHVAYRGVVPMDAVPEHLRSNSVMLWAGPHCHVAHYPMRRGELFNVGAIFHSRRFESGANTFGDPQELHQHFDGVSPHVAGLLGLIDEWRMWVLRDRDPVETWNTNRIALMGDAAHPTLQYLAQGAGMAIEDAWVLGQELSAADDVPTALKRYEQQRVARTGRVTVISRLYGQLYHATGVERQIRSDLLQNWTDEAALRAFSWIYSGI